MSKILHIEPSNISTELLFISSFSTTSISMGQGQVRISMIFFSGDHILVVIDHYCWYLEAETFTGFNKCCNLQSVQDSPPLHFIAYQLLWKVIMGHLFKVCSFQIILDSNIAKSHHAGHSTWRGREIYVDSQDSFTDCCSKHEARTIPISLQLSNSLLLFHWHGTSNNYAWKKDTNKIASNWYPMQRYVSMPMS